MSRSHSTTRHYQSAVEASRTRLAVHACPFQPSDTSVPIESLTHLCVSGRPVVCTYRPATATGMPLHLHLHSYLSPRSLVLLSDRCSRCDQPHLQLASRHHYQIGERGGSIHGRTDASVPVLAARCAVHASDDDRRLRHADPHNSTGRHHLYPYPVGSRTLPLSSSYTEDTR